MSFLAKSANALPVWGFNYKDTTASSLAYGSNWQIKTLNMVRWASFHVGINCCCWVVLEAMLADVLKSIISHDFFPALFSDFFLNCVLISSIPKCISHYRKVAHQSSSNILIYFMPIFLPHSHHFICMCEYIWISDENVERVKLKKHIFINFPSRFLDS